MKLGRKDYARDLEDALEYVPADVSPPTRVEILLALSRCPPEITNERSYAEEALALARQTGDEANEASALLTLAMFDADPGQQAPSDSGPLELIAQARGMAERRGAEDVLLTAAVNESHLLEGAGEHELAAEAARRATVSADVQLLSRTSGSVLAVNQAEPLFALGRWDEALRVANGAMDRYLAPGPMNRALLQVIAGSIVLARGDLAAAAQSVLKARDALGSARYEDQHQLPLARLEILFALAKDGPAAALAAASQIMDRFELSGSSPRYAWPVVVAGASAVLTAARLAGVSRDERLRDEAAAIADRLRTVAEKLETFGPAQRACRLTFAAADADAARLLAAFSDATQADAARPGGGDGRRACRDTRRLGPGRHRVGRPQRALSARPGAAARGGCGAGLRRPRRRSGTAAARGPAGRRAGRPPAQRADRDSGPARPDPAGRNDDASADAAPGGELGLTERELEVLRLVAAGRSNREIAAELFISPKTASVHVSNILGKLGVASRGEAAARAHTLRLFDPVPGRRRAVAVIARRPRVLRGP